jgi:hypothetical protein
LDFLFPCGSTTSTAKGSLAHFLYINGGPAVRELEDLSVSSGLLLIHLRAVPGGTALALLRTVHPLVDGKRRWLALTAVRGYGR